MKLIATGRMLAEAQSREQTQAELEAFMRSERLRLKKAEEAQRIAAVRAEKEKTARATIRRAVLTTDNHTRMVRRVTTTTDRLSKDRHLPDHLKACLDAFAILAAEALGIATSDGDDATNKQIASYDGYTGAPAFASKSFSDRQLAGERALREMAARIPDELRETFAQIVAEEIGHRGIRSKTLRELGEELGYLHKQSTAAGGATVFCIVSMIAHYMRGGGRNNLPLRPVEILAGKNILEPA